MKNPISQTQAFEAYLRQRTKQKTLNGQIEAEPLTRLALVTGSVSTTRFDTSCTF